MTPTRVHYWGSRYAIFIGIALTLTLLLLNSYHHLTQRDMGFIATGDGRVFYADARTGLQAGDLVRSIEGEPLAETLWPYYHETLNPPLDQLTLVAERDGQRFSQVIPFDQPAPWRVQLFHFPLVLVAFVYWFYGLWLVLLHGRADYDRAVVFFVFTQLMALLLSAGGLAYKDFLGVVQIALAVVLAVATLHLHLLFPHRSTVPRLGHKIGLLYAITIIMAVVQSLPVLSVTLYQQQLAWKADLPPYLHMSRWFDLALLLCWGATVVVIARSFTYHKDPMERRQLGIVYLSGLLGFLPMLLLSFGPQILGTLSGVRLPFLPHQLSMLSLLAIPFGYGYAIRRHQVIRLERTVSRAAVSFIAILLLILLYWLILTGVHLFHQDGELGASLELGVVLLLALLFNVVRQRLQQWFDQLLYGGWYDYSTVVSMVSASLERGITPHALAQSLSTTLHQAMQVQWVGVLQRDDTGTLRGISVAGDKTVLPWFKQVRLPLSTPLGAWLMQQECPISRRIVERRFPSKGLTPADRKLLKGDHLQLVVPLLQPPDRLLMMMGPKFGGDPYTESDLAIVRVVAQQMTIALENARLAEELARRVSESERYHRRLTEVRDEERKHIARELHDQVIQALVGFNYHLADLDSHLMAAAHAPTDHKISELQEQLTTLIQATRAICYDLRPPTLDLGLLPGLRSVISRFQESQQIPVHFLVEDPHHCSRTVTESMALCLLRCLQEALVNVAKHAHATTVTVQLTFTPYQIHLCIADDGRGIELPERLGDLMNDNHFGLLGMRERVELLQGQFLIQPGASQGTHITIEVPIPPCPALALATPAD